MNLDLLPVIQVECGSIPHLPYWWHSLHKDGRSRWVVYAKAPFAGPEAVLAYLSRSTHRVAISNSRLIAFDQTSVTFRYKNYRCSGVDRQQVMTLAANEFIRRSCCILCRAASTALGTTACSPAAHARPTSPVPASF
jgi:hypothetical protein